MKSIWLDENCRLASYGATTKGAKSRVRIEIECPDGYSLGYLLDGLRQIDDEQRAAAKAEKQPAKAKADRPKQQVEATARLALPFYGSDS